MEAYQGHAEGLHSRCACGGQYQFVTIVLTLPDAHLPRAVVRNVPAEICDCCGETLFSMPITIRLMQILHGNTQPDDVLLTPVYDLNHNTSIG